MTLLNIYMTGLCVLTIYWFIAVYCVFGNLDDFFEYAKEETGIEIKPGSLFELMMTATMWSSYLVYVMWPITLGGLLICIPFYALRKE